MYCFFLSSRRRHTRCALVTGVQTCALPIFPEIASTYSTINTGATMGKHKASVLVRLVPHEQRAVKPATLADPIRQRLSVIPGIEVAILQEGLRSEERRVGKECVSTGRSRGSRYQ